MARKAFKRERRLETATSFLLPSGIAHRGKTYEDYYANLHVPERTVDETIVALTPTKKRKSKKLRHRPQIDPYYRSPEWRVLRFDVLVRDNRTCFYCGQPGEQADHILPRGAGGPDVLENLVCACSACNRVAGGRVFKDRNTKKAWIIEKRGLTKKSF